MEVIDTVEWKDLARKTHQRKGLVSYVNQWRSQDIAIAFVQTSVRSAKAYRGFGGILPPPNFTASQVGSEAIYCTEV